MGELEPLHDDQRHAPTALSDAALGYVARSRADSTKAGYESDWREWSDWCQRRHVAPLPADSVALAEYLTELSLAGAAVGTIARRLSTLRQAHKTAQLPLPDDDARVRAVWDGIRRSRRDEATDEALPLYPPMLGDVVDACPTVRRFKGKRADEPSLIGLRNRALLLVGFVAAMRRSELVAIDVEHLSAVERGYSVSIPHSKTNQLGDPETVILPRQARARYDPVLALDAWLEAAGIREGAVFRSVTKGNRIGARLAARAVNTLLQQCVRDAGFDADGYSAHSLRAGFVTYAVLQGQSGRAIAKQTRHRSLASVSRYTRLYDAWDENAAAEIKL